MEETATSYMPTDIDLESLMPDEASQGQTENLVADTGPGEARSSIRNRPREKPASKQDMAPGGDMKRKRISLYLDDDVLTKVFRVSLERHEQLSAATHRLILEALKARGL